MLRNTLKRVDGDVSRDLSPTTIGGGSSDEMESYLTAVWNDHGPGDPPGVSDLTQLLEEEIRNIDSTELFELARAHYGSDAAVPPLLGDALAEEVGAALGAAPHNEAVVAWPTVVPPPPALGKPGEEVHGAATLDAAALGASPLFGLCVDQSGNHFVQKLLESPATSALAFEQALRGHCVELAYNAYGCRVLQKALECLPTNLRVYICHKELGPHIAALIQDQHGNHVIQKCVDKLPPRECWPIIEACLAEPLRLSLHAYGCRVMQRILEHCQHSLRTHALLDAIQPVLPLLLKDQFGNYVVQHILKYGRYCDVKCIVETVVANLLSYSCHKYSSNVAERCLEPYIPTELRARLVTAAFEARGPDKPPILNMIRDPYANYVVQKILASELINIEDARRREVLARLEKHLPALRKFTYGRHIVEGIERLKRQADASRQ